MFCASMVRMALAASLVTSLFAGCAGKEEVQDRFEGLTAADGKADLPGSIKLVGSLSYGETSATVVYKKVPKYRAFKFGGQKGDQVQVDVRSSNGGDAVAWVLDDSFKILAMNDDASENTYDAHLALTLPGNKNPDIITYYIVFRDYDLLNNKKFTVSLAGQAATFDACSVDADCLKIHVGCCKRFEGAINASQLEAYQASLSCPANPICPAVLTQMTDRVAQCNSDTKKCELVAPNDIRCGGHVINNHACPDQYECVGEGLAADIPGACRKRCGGFGNFGCGEGFECVDDWRDDCDVNNGGADCGGLCMPPACGGVDQKKCAAGLTCVDDPTDMCWLGSDPGCGGICLGQ
jgi:hypothetical protein